MRKEARARILGKRAAAAAMQASRAGGGRGAAARGAKARVFRRAKRDCLVTDARRQMLGAYIFCGEDHTSSLVAVLSLRVAAAAVDDDDDDDDDSLFQISTFYRGGLAAITPFSHHPLWHTVAASKV